MKKVVLQTFLSETLGKARGVQGCHKILSNQRHIFVYVTTLQVNLLSPDGRFWPKYYALSICSDLQRTKALYGKEIKFMSIVIELSFERSIKRFTFPWTDCALNGMYTNVNFYIYRRSMRGRVQRTEKASFQKTQKVYIFSIKIKLCPSARLFVYVMSVVRISPLAIRNISRARLQKSLKIAQADQRKHIQRPQVYSIKTVLFSSFTIRYSVQKTKWMALHFRLYRNQILIYSWIIYRSKD